MIDRFLLWIDAVGGYFVCGDDRITLGRAAPSNDVSVPIEADISRQHACLERRGDCYVLQPGDDLWLGGQPVDEPRLLHSGDLLQLGATVRFRFVQPHALSATARLDRVSHHRTRPASDGVVLLAESCVLGPSPTAHLPCRRWAGDVILYRCDGTLCVRSAEPFQVDGKAVRGRAPLTRSSRVVGADFSFCLEELP